jgi:hypothetical protein
MSAALLAAALLAAAFAAPARAGGQPLAERVARAGDGPVRFRYGVRDGVCGAGPRAIAIRGPAGTARYGDSWSSDDDVWDDAACEPGPARVTLTVRDGVPRAVRVTVGGPGGGARPAAPGGEPGADLGAVPAAAAAAYLLALAARDDAPNPGRLLLAASIADSSVVWPELLALARDARRAPRTRREATQWAGRAACEAAAGRAPAAAGADTAGREIRKEVVFALSQPPDDERVATLTRVARGDRDPAVRCSALFWLGQAGGRRVDARVLDLYEAVLRGR